MRFRVLLSIFLFCFVAAPAEAASLEHMAGQMIMVGFRGTGEAPLHEDIRFLLEDVAAGRVGGVILFERDAVTKERGRNVRSLKQVRLLTDMLQARTAVPLFVGVDQEGGLVQRFLPAAGVPDTLSPADLGRGTAQATGAAATRLSAKLLEAGVNLDFAPSLDVNVNPYSPAIGALGRSFSSDPAVVTAHAGAFAGGLQQNGIIFCWKHFPGHGSATADSHEDLPDISSTWSDAELLPYKKLLRSGQPGMVMVGHLFNSHLDSVYPSSLSASVINGLLRRDLGWDGVVITDDLQMKAVGERYSMKESIALAVNAGVDVLLFGNNLVHDPQTGRKAHAALMELVREGRISQARIEESYKRIQSLKVKIALHRPLVQP